MPNFPWAVFFEKILIFFKINMFLMFSYYFDIRMSKIFFKKIILMCFEMKSTLKNNRYHTSKHPYASLLGFFSSNLIVSWDSHIFHTKIEDHKNWSLCIDRGHLQFFLIKNKMIHLIFLFLKQHAGFLKSCFFFLSKFIII